MNYTVTYTPWGNLLSFCADPQRAGSPWAELRTCRSSWAEFQASASFWAEFQFSGSRWADFLDTESPCAEFRDTKASCAEFGDIESATQKNPNVWNPPEYKNDAPKRSMYRNSHASEGASQWLLGRSVVVAVSKEEKWRSWCQVTHCSLRTPPRSTIAFDFEYEMIRTRSHRVYIFLHTAHRK